MSQTLPKICCRLGTTSKTCNAFQVVQTLVFSLRKMSIYSPAVAFAIPRSWLLDVRFYHRSLRSSVLRRRYWLQQHSRPSSQANGCRDYLHELSIRPPCGHWPKFWLCIPRRDVPIKADAVCCHGRKERDSPDRPWLPRVGRGQKTSSNSYQGQRVWPVVYPKYWEFANGLQFGHLWLYGIPRTAGKKLRRICRARVIINYYVCSDDRIDTQRPYSAPSWRR